MPSDPIAGVPSIKEPDDVPFHGVEPELKVEIRIIE
jgi:hypothetical protein